MGGGGGEGSETGKGIGLNSKCGVGSGVGPGLRGGPRSRHGSDGHARPAGWVVGARAVRRGGWGGRGSRLHVGPAGGGAQLSSAAARSRADSVRCSVATA